MTPIEHFVPGNPETGQDDQVLPRLRWPIAPGVIEAYVAAYTRPGDTVLLPYCQDAAEVREIVRLGRRAVGVHYDPGLLLLVQATLWPVSARELDGAVARLGDSRKQGVPLRRHLDELYVTTCPACLRPVAADYFIWEQGAPVAKRVRCPHCEWDGRTGVEPADVDRLAEIPTRGLSYHYVLDRIAPHPEGDALRGRLEPLLELYTARNLAALADLTVKIDALFAEGPLRRALLVLLLDCLDRASSLAPLPGAVVRRRGVNRPARFVERNVWCAFEEAAARLRSAAVRPVAGLADSPQALAAEGSPHGYVGPGVVRDLPRLLPGGAPLILISPPPLDSAAWMLSYLWGAWLLDWDAVAPLRPLLRQRTADPGWYARVMAGSLATLAGLAGADGRLALILTGQRPAVVEALLWAAARAGLSAGPVLQAGADYRVELAPGPPAAGAAPGPLAQEARDAALAVIRERGEPAPWRTVHAAIHGRLAESGLLARLAGDNGSGGPEAIADQVRAAVDRAGLVRFDAEEGGDELLWPARPAGLAEPLADRVEAAALDVLARSSPLDRAAFAGRLYALFPGRQTPEPGLVAACLASYGDEFQPGRWQLRAEDRPEARDAERGEIVAHLLALGERLGYRARAAEPFDVAWLDGRHTRAAFAVRSHAAVGDAAGLGFRGRGARPYLVIPGSRAALVAYKLARHPPWRRALDEAGWQFIKYRHVRELAAEPDVDEYSLRAIVGLDPIVEREAAQIPLF